MSYEINRVIVQKWYVAIDVNDQIVAMFLNKIDCLAYTKAMEDLHKLPYTQDEYKMILT